VSRSTLAKDHPTIMSVRVLAQTDRGAVMDYVLYGSAKAVANGIAKVRARWRGMSVKIQKDEIAGDLVKRREVHLTVEVMF
jgi:hypothetical protein